MIQAETRNFVHVGFVCPPSIWDPAGLWAGGSWPASQMITLRMIHSVIASSTVPHTNGKGLRKPEVPACPLSQRAQTGTQINVMKVTGQSISAEAKTWPVDAGIGFLKSFMLDQLLIPE